jgi:hypothetical protein
MNRRDFITLNRLKKDWMRRTGGFWVRCARSSESEARLVSQLEDGMMERARIEIQRARKETIDEGRKRAPLDKWLTGFNFPVPGWRGDMSAWERAVEKVRAGKGLVRAGAF